MTESELEEAKATTSAQLRQRVEDDGVYAAYDDEEDDEWYDDNDSDLEGDDDSELEGDEE